jgi:hypothetical protein
VGTKIKFPANIIRRSLFKLLTGFSIEGLSAGNNKV